MNTFKVIYQFSHNTMGFQNQVTVTAENEAHALTKAREEITEYYRVKPKEQKKWTFKNLITK